MNHTFEDDWLAKALVYYQIIDESLYEELVLRNSDEKYFYNILTKDDYLSEKEIRQFIKSALQIPTLSTDKLEAEEDVIELIPEEICHKYNLIGLKMNNTHIAVAFSNPFNLDAENEIEYLTRKYVKKFFAPVDLIKEKINEYYAPEKLITAFVKKSGTVNIKFAGDTNFDSDSPVVKLVDQIISDAIQKEASDIHIEAKEKSILVRVRIDGVLRNELEVPRSIHSALASRIKIISNMNIAETRKPQDGNAKVKIEDMDIDLRVSVLPTSFGEKIVIRILDKRRASVSLDQMGIKGFNRNLLEKCFELRQGMVLVTGPTGSGKSTTLYAAINRIRSTTNNILTIEDPIEYMFEGINQVQVNERAGVTFASALRSFLRQDPDVILIGEIRDKETAEISIQASLTGHLVLSTLHTNDTFTTITRLKDMGVDKFKITEALQAVIAQRLVRTLCPNCKTRVAKENVDEKLYSLLTQFDKEPKVYEPKGCAKCGYMGYKGRVGVFEILVLDGIMKDLVANDASVQVMRKTAKTNGFRNLFEDAMSLVATGDTDYAEVVRVINPSFEGEPEKPVQSSETITNTSEKIKLEIEKSPKTVDKKTDLLTPEKPTTRIEDQKAKILITDDSEQTRTMVTTIIKKLTKWEIMEAKDGQDALKIIKKEKPDIMVLDIMMPNMDGYELLQEMKSNPKIGSIPVLIFSALKTPKTEEKVYELGADGFIVKPIEPKRMIEQIGKVLIRNREINSDTTSQEAPKEIELKLV